MHSLKYALSLSWLHFLWWSKHVLFHFYNLESKGHRNGSTLLHESESSIPSQSNKWLILLQIEEFRSDRTGWKGVYPECLHCTPFLQYNLHQRWLQADRNATVCSLHKRWKSHPVNEQPRQQRYLQADCFLYPQRDSSGPDHLAAARGSQSNHARFMLWNGRGVHGSAAGHLLDGSDCD